MAQNSSEYEHKGKRYTKGGLLTDGQEIPKDLQSVKPLDPAGWRKEAKTEKTLKRSVRRKR